MGTGQWLFCVPQLVLLHSENYFVIIHDSKF